jgi:hypothetical protein
MKNTPINTLLGRHACDWFLEGLGTVSTDLLLVRVVAAQRIEKPEFLTVMEGVRPLGPLQPVRPGPGSRRAQITFADVMLFQVVDELSTLPKPDEVSGAPLAVISPSSFMEHAKQTYPPLELRATGEMVHYQLVTEDAAIDVLATSAPVVEELERVPS